MTRWVGVLSNALQRVVSPLPANSALRVFRDAFTEPCIARRHRSAPHRLAIQLVEDPFYFALFGAVVAELKQHHDVQAELVVVRATSGAVGVGLRASVLRSIPMTWILSTQWVRAYAGLIDRVAYRSHSHKYFVRNLIDWFRSVAIWLRWRKRQGGFALTVRGVEVGDLISDSYLRFRPSPCFEASDPFVIRLIWQTHCAIRQSQAYFRRELPRLYLTSYSTYIEHGIPVRVALQAGIKVYSFGSLSRFDKSLSLADWYHTPNCMAYRSTFERLDSQDERLAAAEVRLQSRLSGGVDLATSYMKVSAYAASADTLPGDIEDAVVVFLHDFYDSPHVYADFIFGDFWAWASFTIETLSRAGLRFYLKPHPNQVELSNDALDRLKSTYPAVRYLSATITNSQLAKAGMACGVTVYGTVAHELAYLGVPSIACARHPHVAFDFCSTAKTVDEYGRFLQYALKLPFDSEAMQRQALAFYYMHNLHGSDEELALRSHFNALWRACQDPKADSRELVDSLARLRQAPAFQRRMQEILEAADGRA